MNDRRSYEQPNDLSSNEPSGWIMGWPGWWRASIGLGAVATALGLATITLLRDATAVRVVSRPATSGPIVRRVIVNGTLQPVTTVEVGTQVSGTIAEISADFNSIVHSGQVLLRLDPALYQAALDEARAGYEKADADVAAAKAEADDASTKLMRAEDLAAKQLIPLSDLDTARTEMAQANADLEAAWARADEARAELQQATVSLRQTIIRSPVDGVVTARNVDVGVTVSAVQASPVLFRIATDFRHMQVLADVDESDIAPVKPGELAQFEVEAYPGRTFEGHVAAVRFDAVREPPSSEGLAPSGAAAPTAAAPGVVSYPVVIDVENHDEALRPGMTALVALDGARRDAVTRIPNGALAFEPSAQVLEATRQDVPAEPEIGKAIEQGMPARVWEFDGMQFTPVPIRVGLADDAWTELISGPIRPGVPLITSASVGPSLPAH